MCEVDVCHTARSASAYAGSCANRLLDLIRHHGSCAMKESGASAAISAHGSHAQMTGVEGDRTDHESRLSMDFPAHTGRNGKDSGSVVYPPLLKETEVDRDAKSTFIDQIWPLQVTKNNQYGHQSPPKIASGKVFIGAGLIFDRSRSLNHRLKSIKPLMDLAPTKSAGLPLFLLSVAGESYAPVLLPSQPSHTFRTSLPVESKSFTKPKNPNP